MALKDLVEAKSALTEEAIETIVRSFVIYDVAAREVILTPDGMLLPNRSKLLVYLAALQGWQFVTDEPVSSDARPVDIEKATGIAGGSLRPLLKELLKARLLTTEHGRYYVRSTSFAAIASDLNSASKRRAPARRNGRAAA